MPAYPSRLRPLTSGNNAALAGALTALQGTSDAFARKDHVHPVRWNLPQGSANNPVANSDVTMELTSAGVLTFRWKDSTGAAHSSVLMG